jgi:DNA-binding NarL/FixJ family response regulator
MSRSVAIVDDHFLFAEALAGAVKEIGGHEVAGIAVTGAQAVSLVRDKQPDIVLLDYHLPGYKGNELIERIKSAAPQARVIVVTSDSTEASLGKAMEAGASAYITKDRAIEDVVQALRDATAEANGATGTEQTLTTREIEILRLVESGKDANAIAAALGLSVYTVRTHLQNTFEKLGAHSQIEALAIARKRSMLR